MYSAADVERLTRARRLVDAGMDISEVSRLSDEQHEELLLALAEQGVRVMPTPATSEHIERREPVSPKVIVVGEALTVILSQVTRVNPRIEMLASYAQERDIPQCPETPEGCLLILEQPALHSQTPALVKQTASKLKAAATLIFYNFGTRKAIDSLNTPTTKAVPLPLRALLVEREILLAWSTLISRDELAVPTPPRFSEHTLAIVAQGTPSIACECPQHIAQTLMNVQAFERYSAECETNQPEDAALHVRLRETAALARTLFEEALVDVARIEGIDLTALTATESPLIDR